ncbi:hypothetical protein ACP4OV_008677 [Aristida adscensionis]
MVAGDGGKGSTLKNSVNRSASAKSDPKARSTAPNQVGKQVELLA